MIRSVIEVPAFDTGRSGVGRVRNSLAFDMRGVAFGEPMHAAVLELPTRVAPRCASVRLLEPSTGSTYAGSTGVAGRLVLTGKALRDLSAATGAFFYCDAILEDETGASMTLPAGIGPCVLRIEQSAAANEGQAIAA